MKNTSDYLMLGLLLICMRYDENVCYKVLDNTTISITVRIIKKRCVHTYHLKPNFNLSILPVRTYIAKRHKTH